jgi:hypothetical protein
MSSVKDYEVSFPRVKAAWASNVAHSSIESRDYNAQSVVETFAKGIAGTSGHHGALFHGEVHTLTSSVAVGTSVEGCLRNSQWELRNVRQQERSDLLRLPASSPANQTVLRFSKGH